MNSPEKAFSTPFLILVLLFIGAMLHTQAYLAFFPVQTYAAELHAEKAKRLARNRALQFSAPYPELSHPELQIQSFASTVGRSKQSYQRLAVNAGTLTPPGSVPANLAAPLLPLEQLFEDASVCPFAAPSTSESTQDKRSLFLSSYGLRSAYFCDRVYRNSRGILKPLLGNFVFHSLALAAEDSLLLASGAIWGTGTLILENSNVIIIAGGDVFLEKLVASTPAPVTITIISLTGAIKVSHASGEFRWRLHSKLGVELPFTYTTPENDLSPPLLKGALIALAGTSH